MSSVNGIELYKLVWVQTRGVLGEYPFWETNLLNWKGASEFGDIGARGIYDNFCGHFPTSPSTAACCSFEIRPSIIVNFPMLHKCRMDGCIVPNSCLRACMTTTTVSRLPSRQMSQLSGLTQAELTPDYCLFHSSLNSTLG